MTPAINLLRREGIAFTEHPYDHDAGADSFGEEAAAKLGVEASRVFKALVCAAADVGLVMALVPSSARLDLKALARTLGVKKADLADPALAERTTGFVVGGISPLGGRKRLPTFIDDSALPFDTVLVSAGRRGLQVELSPADLVRVTDATTAKIASGAA